MNLTDSQIELLTKIQTLLRRGDITEISTNTGLSREYVGKVLSPVHSEVYNDDVVKEAVRIIDLRKQDTTQHLEKLTA